MFVVQPLGCKGHQIADAPRNKESSFFRAFSAFLTAIAGGDGWFVVKKFKYTQNADSLYLFEMYL